MHSKRDQVQAHLFIMGRLASAMLRAEPDAPESPSGRTNRGAAIGLIIALLVCAGAFVFGLIKPGGKDSWRTSGDLVVNKQTGARYLFLDGYLRPVRNYTSARLLVGEDLRTTTVTTASLGDTLHGTPIGIPDAPDALPDDKDLDTRPWQVCSVTKPRATGSVTVTTTLTIGSEAARNTTGGRELGSTEGLLLTGSDGATYLLWQGTRLRLDEKSGAADALGYGAVVPRRASAAFVDAFPQGPDLAPPAVADRGADGPSLGGRRTRIGQVFRVDVPGSAPRYHLLQKKGLVPLTATGAALVLGDPQTRKAYGGAAATVATLRADALSGHLARRIAADSDASARLPGKPPEAVEVPAGSVACAEVSSAAGSTRVGLSVRPADALGETVQAPARGVEPACRKVDAVKVRPGTGTLVRALSASGSALGDTTFLVTDDGVKYRLRSQEAVKALGFENAAVRTLPSQLLSMLPTGPDLTSEAASAGTSETTGQCERADRATRTKGAPADRKGQ